MDYYVKELADKRAVLIAEDGYSLGEFSSVNLAVLPCREECHVVPSYIERHYSYLGQGPGDFESSFVEH